VNADAGAGRGFRARDREISSVFHALADPTRRAVVERLGRGPASTTELARPFGMALPSFAQHLQLLEQAGLVQSHKQGRVRHYRLAPRPLAAVEDWMQAQQALWNQRLDQLHVRRGHPGLRALTAGRPPGRHSAT
jgi:DNA-binding transcriptional ArsR family regulator